MASEAPTENRIAAGRMSAFSAWLARARAAREVYFSSDGVIELGQGLARQFGIGLIARRFHICVPADVAPWFVDLPWSHVAHSAESATLALVASPGPGPQAAPTVLAFPRINDELSSYLANYLFIDIRSFEGCTDDGETFAVGRRVLKVLPLVGVNGIMCAQSALGPAAAEQRAA